MGLLIALLASSLQAQVPALLEEKRKVLETRMESVDRALRALEAVQAEYRKDGDAPRHSAEREAARSRLGGLMAEYSPLADEFNQQRQQAESTMIASLVQDFTRSGIDASNIQAHVAQNQGLAKFTEEVFNLERRANLLLKEEESEYRLLELQQKTRRRMLIVLSCGGAATALFLVVLYRKLSRQPPPALPVPEVRALPEGSVLAGGFRIGRELGWSSLGCAFEAVDLASSKPVLIKMLHDELNRDPAVQGRFLNLARAAAALKHPNIASVLAAFVHSGRLYIAVERVPGPSLTRLLESGKRPPFQSVQRVLRQVAAALHHAHGMRLLHGDLNPGSIFVTREGTAKVADFALGLELRRAAAKLSWTGVIGSQAYSAPEQETGAALRETDVYSFGVVLYEMVTGKLPFPGPNFLAQKREMHYVPPSKAASGLPPEVDSIVERALQPEPQKRFRSLQDIAQALDGLTGPG